MCFDSFDLNQLNAPILCVILLFPISTLFILWCLSTLPISNSWPSTISDLAQLGRELHGYSQSGPGPLLHVVLVMAFSAIWKHAWSIPGSVLWVCSSLCPDLAFSNSYRVILNFLFSYVPAVTLLERSRWCTFFAHLRNHPAYYPDHARISMRLLAFETARPLLYQSFSSSA